MGKKYPGFFALTLGGLHFYSTGVQPRARRPVPITITRTALDLVRDREALLAFLRDVLAQKCLDAKGVGFKPETGEACRDGAGPEWSRAETTRRRNRP